MPKMREPSRTQSAAQSAAQSVAGAAANAARHLHRFEVETDTDAVHLSIGRPEAEATAGHAAGHAAGHSPVAGGYLKVFNRLIDSGVWATLPDAARAVYLPLARFADARENFKARAGLAALMRHTGLSRSSVKRGLKALQEARLLAVVRVGGVAADGTNRTNVYQLLVPGEPGDDEPVRGGKPVAEAPARKPVQSAARAKRAAKPPADKPPGVHSRTPSRFTAEPPAESAADPRRGSPADPAAGPTAAGTGAGDEPLYRPTSSESISPAAAADVVGEPGWQGPERLARSAQSLQRWGVSPAAARELAARHGPDAVRSAVAAVEPLARQGKLRNAAGFLVSRLEQGWSDAAPAAAASSAGLEERTRVERQRREAEAQSAVAARGSADAEIDALDDATLDALAARVLAGHADRPAMVRLLTAKPPRQSRLMRAEVAALLEV